MQDKIVFIIYDLCYPIILPEIYAVNIEDKVVLVIEVFRGSLLPYYLKSKGKDKGTYIRIGATNRLADRNMIIELERQRLQKTFDEEANHNFKISELDLKILYKEFKEVGKRANLSKLINLKLITTYNNNKIPTNALLIALGKLDNTSIKCARFKGRSMEFFFRQKRVQHRYI